MRISARNLSAWLVARLLIMLGFVRSATKRALNGDFIISIYFHKPSLTEFESSVRWLRKQGFHFLSISDIDHIINNSLPFPKGGVLLTVDDGWQSNDSNIIEVANKYKVPVGIFVSTAPVEDGAFWWSYWLNDHAGGRKMKPAVAALKKVTNRERLLKVAEMKAIAPLKREALTVDQIRKAACSPYITIGGHTHTHPILINCSEDEVRGEFQVSREKLEAWTGKAVDYIAYPNGDYGNREIRILKELNCRVAFCSEPDYITPDRLKDRYSLPRFGFLEGASFAENICRMTGIWKSSVKWLKSQQMERGAVETVYPVLHNDKVSPVSEVQI